MSVDLAVILATYNQPAHLERVLRGYARHSGKDFELIIADDGSSITAANPVAVESADPHDSCYRRQCPQPVSERRVVQAARRSRRYMMELVVDDRAASALVAHQARLDRQLGAS